MKHRLSNKLDPKLDLFAKQITEFEQRKIDYSRLKPVHTQWGIYKERQNENFMIRIRLPGGIITTKQLMSVAILSQKYGNGKLHFTTRQNIQLHQLKLTETYELIKKLHKIDLSSWAGCGDTIRNITTCNNCLRCQFNLYPYAIGLTEFLLAQQTSYNLPRKLKIALSGCKHDCAGACVADIGLIAKRQNNECGFSVYSGGGLGANSKIGYEIENFIPAIQIVFAIEAIKSIFCKLGTRVKRNKARLRFLVNTLGQTKFHKLYRKEKDKIKANLNPEEIYNRVKKLNCKLSDIINHTTNTDFTVPLFLGNIDANKLINILKISREYNIGYITATNTQNIIFRGIKYSLEKAFRAEINKIFSQISYPKIYSNIISCVGATTCTLGICQSQKISADIWQKLSECNLPLSELSDITINISGCLNSCGRTNISSIGLIGCKKKINNKIKYYYIIKLAGKTHSDNSTLAKQIAIIPEDSVSDYIINLLKEYITQKSFTTFNQFAENITSEKHNNYINEK